MRTPFVKVHVDLEKQRARSRPGSQGVVTEGMLLGYISYFEKMRDSFNQTYATRSIPRVPEMQTGDYIEPIESPFDILTHSDPSMLIFSNTGGPEPEPYPIGRRSASSRTKLNRARSANLVTDFSFGSFLNIPDKLYKNLGICSSQVRQLLRSNNQKLKSQGVNKDCLTFFH